MLKKLGYSERFRHEIISDAVQGFKNMQQREEAGGQPVDRPRRDGGGEKEKRENDGTEESLGEQTSEKESS